MISQDTYAPSPTWRRSKDYIVTHMTREQGPSDHVLTPTPGIYQSLAGQMLPAMKAQFCERSSRQKQLKIHFDM